MIGFTGLAFARSFMPAGHNFAVCHFVFFEGSINVSRHDAD